MVVRLNQAGFVGVLVPFTVFLVAIVGVGVTMGKSAELRTVASRKATTTEVSHRALELLLNLPWDHRYLRGGIAHPSADNTDLPIDGALSTLRWQVEDKSARVKRITISENQNNSGIAVTGFKYDDF